MFRFLLYILLLPLPWPLYADTLNVRVVKIANGDTITVLDASNIEYAYKA
jgi:hypothetical protein